MAKRPLAHKDNADGRLNAGISAATTSLPLQSGNGADFPTTARASATSLGSGILLNSTGIQAALSAASVVVGDMIENVTDGSYAIILSISTNSITTTPLVGGSDNTWQNSDVWACRRFVTTLIQYDVDGVTVLKREKVLIGSRSTDTLSVETVPSTGRGYDGSTAQSFDSGDYVYQFALSAAFDGILVAFGDVVTSLNTLLGTVTNKITNTGAEIYAASSGGTDTYAVTLSPAPSSYTNGMEVNFKADVANVDNASLNVNGLGAKNIYKLNGTTLTTGDIGANMIVEVIYNSSLNGGSGGFQMANPVANAPATGADYTSTPFTCGEDLAQGDLLALTAADTVKRYSPTAMPKDNNSSSTAYLDQTATLTGTFAYSNGTRIGVVVSLSSLVKGMAYQDSNSGTPGMSVLRVPVTPSTGAVGTLSQNNNIVSGFTNAETIDAVDMGSNRMLMVESKSNAFSYVVSDMSSSISLGTSGSIDTSNVRMGFCEYISDSHVLFFSEDTSASSIQFYKYTASGTTLSASTTGTVQTLVGKTFYLKGVRRFGTTNYFLFLLANTTDATAQAIIAYYDTGTSSFTTVGTTTNFTGSQQLFESEAHQAAMVNLDDTHIMVHCPTSSTASVTFLVYRSSSSSTTPLFGSFNTYTGGSNHGYSLTKLNARSAIMSAMNGTTMTMTMWEVNAAGTDLTSRYSTTGTTAVDGNNNISNGLTAFFPVSPVRVGRISIGTSDSDFDAGTGACVFPPIAGIATAAGSNGGSITAITGGYSDDVSSLTAASRYYADIAGLLTTVSDGTPDKVGRTKDATELLVGAW